MARKIKNNEEYCLECGGICAHREIRGMIKELKLRLASAERVVLSAKVALAQHLEGEDGITPNGVKALELAIKEYDERCSIV